MAPTHTIAIWQQNHHIAVWSEELGCLSNPNIQVDPRIKLQKTLGGSIKGECRLKQFASCLTMTIGC